MPAIQMSKLLAGKMPLKVQQSVVRRLNTMLFVAEGDVFKTNLTHDEDCVLQSNRLTL